MNASLYTVEILRLAASLPEPVVLSRIDGSGEARSPACGSRLVTNVELTPEGRIEALSQQVHACAFGQASAALVAGHSSGRSREEVEQALAALTEWLDGAEALPDWPGMAALAPARARKARHGAILLPLRALIAAMEDAQMTGTRT